MPPNFPTASQRQNKHNNLFIIPINQPTRCNNFSSLLLDVYVQLNMFRASSSGDQQLQQQPLVLPLERGGSSAVCRCQAGRPAYHASLVQQPRSGLGQLIVEVPRTHTIRHTHSLGLLLTNDQPVEEAPAYTTNTRDKHPSPQRDPNPRSQ
jgi:hypothetical protein